MNARKSRESTRLGVETSFYGQGSIYFCSSNVPLRSPGRAGVEMRKRIEDGDGDDDYCVRYSPNQYPYPLPLVEEGEDEYRNGMPG